MFIIILTPLFLTEIEASSRVIPPGKEREIQKLFESHDKAEGFHSTYEVKGISTTGEKLTLDLLEKTGGGDFSLQLTDPMESCPGCLEAGAFQILPGESPKHRKAALLLAEHLAGSDSGAIWEKPDGGNHEMKSGFPVSHLNMEKEASFVIIPPQKFADYLPYLLHCHPVGRTVFLVFLSLLVALGMRRGMRSKIATTIMFSAMIATVFGSDFTVRYEWILLGLDESLGDSLRISDTALVGEKGKIASLETNNSSRVKLFLDDEEARYRIGRLGLGIENQNNPEFADALRLALVGMPALYSISGELRFGLSQSGELSVVQTKSMPSSFLLLIIVITVFFSLPSFPHRNLSHVPFLIAASIAVLFTVDLVQPLPFGEVSFAKIGGDWPTMLHEVFYRHDRAFIFPVLLKAAQTVSVQWGDKALLFVCAFAATSMSCLTMETIRRGAGRYALLLPLVFTIFMHDSATMTKSLLFLSEIAGLLFFRQKCGENCSGIRLTGFWITAGLTAYTSPLALPILVLLALSGILSAAFGRGATYLINKLWWPVVWICLPAMFSNIYVWISGIDSTVHNLSTDSLFLSRLTRFYLPLTPSITAIAMFSLMMFLGLVTEIKQHHGKYHNHGLAMVMVVLACALVLPTDSVSSEAIHQLLVCLAGLGIVYFALGIEFVTDFVLKVRKNKQLSNISMEAVISALRTIILVSISFCVLPLAGLADPHKLMMKETIATGKALSPCDYIVAYDEFSMDALILQGNPIFHGGVRLANYNSRAILEGGFTDSENPRHQGICQATHLLSSDFETRRKLQQNHSHLHSIDFIDFFRHRNE